MKIPGFVLAVAVAALMALAAEQQPTGGRERAYSENNVGVAHLERYDFSAAAAAFRRALEIDRTLSMARLNLAIALLYANQPEAAAPEARAAAQAMPESPQAHFVLGLAARAQDRSEEATAAFRRVLAIDPTDVGSRIQLAQILLAEQKYPEAIRLFEEASQREAFNATAMYGLGTALTRSGDRDKGATALTRFQQLRDNPASITYSSAYLEQGRYGEALASTGLEPELVDRAVPDVVFTDATADMLPRPDPTRAEGANAAVLFDADGDGDLDLALSDPGPIRLLRNVGGRLSGPAATLHADAEPTALVAGDYDNDGRPDLFQVSRGITRLIHQEADGTWREVSAEKQLPPARGSMSAAFADLDHDGDLDIVTGGPRFLRNNGNRTFTDATAAAGLTGAPAQAVVAIDFDNRRDLDVLFVRADVAPALFSNARDGTFRDVAGEVGLAADVRARAIAVGDVNKDGAPDFFFARVDGRGRFAMSSGTGRLTLVDGPAMTPGALAAQLIDYDNDGLLDLFVCTETGARLWRNLGKEWMDVTARALPKPGLPNEWPQQMHTGDLDGDGDTDVIVHYSSSRIGVWRNEGGNHRPSLTVRLAARVSNRSAIGAKIDLRAGSLQQRLETTSATPPAAPADVVFGLGARARADVVRVLWPAGILQAETPPPNASRAGAAAPFTITELNRKPSSCPFLYTWNGSRFEFVTDFMGGGEMGAWAGPGAWSVPDPDEYVRIRADQLRPRDGRYELRVTSELEEAVFLDRLHLVAVAHPIGVDVYPNEGLRSPAARAAFALTTVRDPRPPKAVVDHHGHDVLDRVVARDRRFVDDFRREPIQGYAEEHWVTIDLGVKPGDTRAHLLLTGWTDYAFSSDNVAAHQAGLPVRLPALEIKDAAGKWVTAIAEIGLPVGRPQTVVIDLTPYVARGVREVRIATTLRVYWDQILVDTSQPAPLSQKTVEADAAVLRWRGFSAETSPDGREPFGYDYTRVANAAPWKLMPGRYTREGDVRPLLSASDDRFVIAAPGDEVALSFAAADVPAPPAGWTTTFLLFADGFSKEMNVRSASPDRVEPLPFHAMSGYPYPAAERYPDSPEHQRYRTQYNTRILGRAR